LWNSFFSIWHRLQLCGVGIGVWVGGRVGNDGNWYKGSRSPTPLSWSQRFSFFLSDVTTVFETRYRRFTAYISLRNGKKKTFGTRHEPDPFTNTGGWGEQKCFGNLNETWQKQHSMSVKLKQFITPSCSHYNEPLLHLIINSFLEMATKVHIRTTHQIYSINQNFWRNINDWMIQPIVENKVP